MATQIYRKQNDPNIYEVGTDRVIGATEFGRGGFTEPNPLPTGSQDGQVVNTPETPSPDIVRNGSGISILNSSNSLIDAARELMLRKQKMNKDLTAQEAYWKQVGTDNSRFGSPKSKTAPAGLDWSPDLIGMNAMPMADKEAIRLSRQRAADANLSSLNTERKYRENTFGNTVNALKDYIDTNSKSSKEQTTIDKILAYKKIGQDPPVALLKELQPTLIGNKYGGTAAWRNNNRTELTWDPTLVRNLEKDGINVSEGSQNDKGETIIAFDSNKDFFDAVNKMFTDPKYGMSEMSVTNAIKKLYGGKLTDEQINKGLLEYGVGQGPLSMFMPYGELKNGIFNFIQDNSNWDQGNGGTIDMGSINSDNLWSYSDSAGIALYNKLYSVDHSLSPAQLQGFTIQEVADLVSETKDSVKKDVEDTVKGILKNDPENGGNLDYLIFKAKEKSGELFSPAELEIMITALAPNAIQYSKVIN